MNNKEVVANCEKEVLRMLAVAPRRFVSLIAALGGYHAGNYRPLDQALQRLRKRGLIRFDSKIGWHLTPPEQTP